MATDRGEQRQHLSISTHAYEILLNDISAFSEKGGISGIINRIIRNYLEDSEASITCALEKKKSIYTKQIEDEKTDSSPLTPAEKKVVGLLTAAYRKELIDKNTKYKKPLSNSKTLKIRLQNDIYDILGPSEPLPEIESTVYKTSGNYIKAIIEDYANLSLFKREEIYFKDLFNLISTIVSIEPSKRSLYTIKIDRGTEKPQAYRIKPYLLSSSSHAPYHYLVALSKKASSERSSYSPASFRLSRIISINKTPSYGSGKITANEKAEIEKGIRDKGIPYLSADVKRYRVLLTPTGIDNFNRILHQRPIPDKTEKLPDGSVIMSFTGTDFQMESYFTRLGKDARILSPKSTANHLKKVFGDAYKTYEKSTSKL